MEPIGPKHKEDSEENSGQNGSKQLVSKRDSAAHQSGEKRDDGINGDRAPVDGCQVEGQTFQALDPPLEPVGVGLLLNSTMSFSANRAAYARPRGVATVWNSVFWRTDDRN